MALSSYRMHKIYLAAIMNYGLGSEDPEELAYYKKLRKEMDEIEPLTPLVDKKSELPRTSPNIHSSTP